MLYFCGWFIRFQCKGIPHDGQHFGVNGIGFCAYTLCLRKSTRLQRVHLYQWQMRAQGAFKPAVVSACCFINNAYHRRLAQNLESALNPAGQLLNDIIFPSLSR